MRPTTGRVDQLTATAQERLDRLVVLALPLTFHVRSEERRLISYVVIEAANLWAQYSRSFFLSCALGAREPGGNRIVATPATSLDAALTLAVHAVRPKLRGSQQQWKRHQLPDFQNRSDLAKTLRYVNASVAPTVDAALAYQSRVLADLPTMRNFFAHKAERAAQSARNLSPRYGLTRTLTPEDLLCTPPRTGGRGDILIREWLADLRAIFGLMP